MGDKFNPWVDEPAIYAERDIEPGSFIAQDLFNHGLSDSENLSSARDILSRGYGFLPGQEPTIRVEPNLSIMQRGAESPGKNANAWGYSEEPFRNITATHRLYPPGLPFDPHEQRNPTGGTITLRPATGPDADYEQLFNLNHEMSHQWYARNLNMPRYQSRPVDYTHGPQGVDAFYPGPQISSNPYYQDSAASTPWVQRRDYPER